VVLVWKAAAIAPGQFQQFSPSVGPLPDTDVVLFRTLRTYSDGQVVRWIDEPVASGEPEHPAPVLHLTAAEGAEGAGAGATAGVAATPTAAAEGSGAGTRADLGVGIAALLAAPAALGLTLVRTRRPAA
jgi:hypothetical protein